MQQGPIHELSLCFCLFCRGKGSMLSCKMSSEGLVLTLSPKLILCCKRIQTSIGQTSERLWYVCNIGMVEVIRKFIFTWQCVTRVWSECHLLGPIGVTLWEPKSDVVTYMSLFLCSILGLAGSWKRTAHKMKTRSGVFLQGCRKLYKCICFALRVCDIHLHWHDMGINGPGVHIACK